MEAFTRDRDAVFTPRAVQFAFLFLLTVCFLDAVDTDWTEPLGFVL